MTSSPCSAHATLLPMAALWPVARCPQPSVEPDGCGDGSPGDAGGDSATPPCQRSPKGAVGLPQDDEVGGEILNVSGTVWFDFQLGALQLDDNSETTVFQMGEAGAEVLVGPTLVDGDCLELTGCCPGGRHPTRARRPRRPHKGGGVRSCCAIPA